MSISNDVQDQNLDRLIFFGSVLIIFSLCIPLALFPKQGAEMLGAAFNYLTQNFGIFYVVGSVATVGFLGFIAFSRHGAIRLGDEAPDFSTASWFAMLFCGGIGTSVLYWGSVEWAYYFQTPPFAVEPKSAEALRWAGSYPIFHWGIMGWAFYCLPGVAVAYSYYVRGVKSLRLSDACEPIIGKHSRGVLGRTIDLLFVVGLVGACSTGIALAVPLIGMSVADLFSLDREAWGFSLDLFVIFVVTCVFASSVWLGLEKGIKRLSDLNIIMAIFLLAFILIAGPTLFMVEMGFDSLGHMAQNFIRMSTWTDPLGTSNFVESWTVFYWAWWLALGPYMGIFITKISKGRTLKQLILGCVCFGTLGCFLFFSILGNYAAYLELNGLFPVLETLETHGPPALIVAVLGTLPMSSLILVVFTLVCVIFAATSYDSASYTLAASATKSLDSNEHPARWHRVFWAFLLGVLPITLVYLGGLEPLKSAVTLVSVPLYAVIVLLTLSMWKSIKQAEKDKARSSDASLSEVS
jgi:BCCT family betaine/carnitine transporter